MSPVSAWEWRYLRGALAALAVVIALQVAGWLVYRVVHEETPPLQETVRCLTREKLLELTTATDPIAAGYATLDPAETTPNRAAWLERFAREVSSR